MADKKISALTSATTPLAGTEVLPIVQSSTTVKVAVSDLTAGRAVSASSLSLTTPLTVANGGTGTGTAFTAGSVVFAGASGVYSQANASFFWDNSNNRLGIGLATPSYTFDVVSAGGVRFTRATSGGSASYAVQLAPNNTASTYGAAAYFGGDIGTTQKGWRIATSYAGSGKTDLVIGYSTAGQSYGSDLTALTYSDYWSFENTANIVQKTASKGINFTANTPAAGMTSQLLNWYEEGTWTPTDASGASLTFTNAFGYYTRTGNIVTLMGRVTFPATASGLGVAIGGLPFTVANNSQPGGGCIRITDSGRNDTVVASAATTQITFYSTSLVQATNANYSGKRVDWVVQYMV